MNQSCFSHEKNYGCNFADQEFLGFFNEQILSLKKVTVTAFCIQAEAVFMLPFYLQLQGKWQLEASVHFVTNGVNKHLATISQIDGPSRFPTCHANLTEGWGLQFPIIL